jgi:hypothetical protein
MGADMKRRTLVIMAIGFAVAVGSAIVLATTLLPLFGPVSGILKGTAGNPQTSAAASSDVIALWSGSCSSSTFLNGAGACAAPTLSGTSSSIGGGALAAGACASTTVTVTGAATTMAVEASPVADPGTGNYWQAFVSSSNTVTVRICAAVADTPTATTYNVRVLQ